MVRFLAQQLTAKGQRVVILTRGYGRMISQQRVLLGGHGCWREYGDEPLMLSRSLPQIPIVVGRDRVAGGRLAMERFRPDTIILDDGMQYLRLARDVEVVVLDASGPFGNGRLFPGGTLRENLSGLRRADLLLITRVNQAADVDALIGFVHSICPKTKVVRGAYQATSLRQVDSPARMSPELLRGTAIVAMSGIANPLSFERSLEQLGARLLHRLRFPDHHPYRRRDLLEAVELARNSGARYVVTSEKDEVRLPSLQNPSPPIMSLGIAIKIVAGWEQLWEVIERGGCYGHHP